MTAMAVTAEELELQEQVARTLESQGVLGKIKAQLRVAVFQAIHGNGGGGSSGALASRSSLSTVQSSNDRLQALGVDGQVALEIVRDFLECLELDHTLTVFLAEANLDGRASDGNPSEWQQPSRLCERVGVAKADELTPVLVKMLREGGQPKMMPAPQVSFPPSVSVYETPVPVEEKQSSETSVKVNSMRDVGASKLDLPPPPALTTQGFMAKKAQEEEEDDEAEMEASMAEEVASGSFEEESLAESVSLSQSHNDEHSYKPTSQVTQRPGQLEMNDEEEEEDVSPAIASPPPVPAKLGTMPPLPGMSIPSTVTKQVKEESEEEEEDEEEDEVDRNDGDDAEDLEDDEADAADRLRSLEAKLKEMEAEDDTGVLQQLKVTKLEDPDEDESIKPKCDDKSENDGQEDDDDNYGSDFEEVEEDMDEVASEMSEDLASMSALSESEEVSVAKAKPAVDILQNDKAVDNEDALNSYDYIEAVERD